MGVLKTAEKSTGTTPIFLIESPVIEKPGKGPVETGIVAQIDQLKHDGWVTDHHAGQVALAVRAARDVDNSEGQGAPSGRANLLRVMNEILERLPQPEVQASSDLAAAIDFIKSGADDDE